MVSLKDSCCLANPEMPFVSLIFIGLLMMAFDPKQHRTVTESIVAVVAAGESSPFGQSSTDPLM